VLQRSIAGLPIGGVLHVPRGPVLDYDSTEAPELFSDVLDRLVQLARQRLAVVRVCPDVKRTTAWVEEILLEKGFHRARRSIGHTATIRLDLTQSLDQIIAGMSRTRRQNIRIIEKEGKIWSYDFDDSIASLELLYGMYRKTIERAGKTPKSYHDLRLMHETLSSYGASIILTVRYDQRPVSTVLLVPMKKHFWGFAASMAEDAKELKYATVAMYWKIIQWAKNQGYAEFDLQGIPESAQPGDPLYGVYRFKQKWGGEEVHLIGDYDYTRIPFLVRLLEWKLAH
jgi:lipid II:glycine glycyltransferase (peptidoglycan interpeptide bridge formation enzyme)